MLQLLMRLIHFNRSDSKLGFSLKAKLTTSTMNTFLKPFLNHFCSIAEANKLQGNSIGMNACTTLHVTGFF